jgi:protein-S-isoprenylcysteine O-methyltransferase Ste14
VASVSKVDFIGLKEMALREEFEASGQWLFRWRGYLPLLIIGMILLSLPGTSRLGGNVALDRAWQIACVLVAFFGQAIRIVTIGHAPRNTSGRNAKEQRADSLNTTGIYSMVRHPLYLGNFFIYLGVVAFTHSPAVIVISLLAYVLHYERIMFAEEAYLREKFGVAYEQWAARTPAIVPSFLHRQASELPFSLNNVLRREYNNFFGIVFALVLIKSVGGYIAQGKILPAPIWCVFFAGSFLIWIVLRTIKRNTEWLRVEGR